MRVNDEVKKFISQLDASLLEHGYDPVGAWWISPKGGILPVPDSHIDMVLETPEKFGLEREYAENVFSRQGKTTC
jgi:hypothetical protein